MAEKKKPVPFDIDAFSKPMKTTPTKKTFFTKAKDPKKQG